MKIPFFKQITDRCRVRYARIKKANDNNRRWILYMDLRIQPWNYIMNCILHVNKNRIHDYSHTCTQHISIMCNINKTIGRGSFTNAISKCDNENSLWHVILRYDYFVLFRNSFILIWNDCDVSKMYIYIYL